MNTETAAAVVPLALRPREAAQALGISDRTLWGLAKRGDIPRVQIGRAVRFDPRDLAAFIDRL